MNQARNADTAVKNKRSTKWNVNTKWINLTEVDKEALRKLADDHDYDGISEVNALVEAGWKVSVSYSEPKQGFVGALTCRSKEDLHNGMCLIISISDLDKLWMTLGYLGRVVIPGGREIEARGSLEDDW